MSGVDLPAAVRLAVVTGVGGLLLAVASGVVAGASGSATAGLLARAVLVTGLLLAAGRALLSGRAAGTVRRTAPAGLLVGYVLTLGWPAGQVYAAQLVVDAPVVAATVDLVLWVAVGTAAAHLARAASDGPAQP